MTFSTSKAPAPPPVPFPRVATFVRQVTHDVRNNLNALDLQSAFLLEIIEDQEALQELRRMRQLIQDAAKSLQGLSANFWTPEPSFIEYNARIFVEDLRDRLQKVYPTQAPQVEWTVELGEEMIRIDIEMMFSVVSELLKNAFEHRQASGTIRMSAGTDSDGFYLDLHETKSVVPPDPEKWGTEPFVSTRRGAYGLGLFRVRTLLAVHDGKISFSHSAEQCELVTRISLPLAPTG